MFFILFFIIIHDDKKNISTLVYGGSYNDYYVIVLYINYNGIMWRPLGILFSQH